MVLLALPRGAIWRRALAILTLCWSGCGEPVPVAAAWPEGTALVVEGLPIAVSEVDAHVTALLDIKPAWSLTHRRRLILINWSFPLAYGQAQVGEQRQAARELAEEWLEGPQTGPKEAFGSGAPDMQGNWDDLGPATWLLARELEVGETSGVVELPGRFAVIHMQSRDNATNPALEQMQLVVKTFPYYDSHDQLISRCLKGRLEIVDPAWREVVPASYKYSMRGEK